MTLTLISTLI